ncbi:sialidase family protein [uncultured Alistipes sp.]|uniref:sialidase family protein n=1 Tax=uncultured Alistipes sp. TaxID=538949 RepID=UPI0026334946|nr:sialidase family protein [uncultured Alistipes sp.]
MKRTLLLPALLLCGVLLSACTVRPPAEPVHVRLFASGDHGSKYYRIPAIVTAADGTLLAVADRRGDSQGDLPNLIDVVLRRSTDRGTTWSEPITIAQHTETCGYGDAALVVDPRSGDVVCIFAAGCGLWASTAEAPTRVCVSRSADNGLTWSPAEDITPQLYGPGCGNPASAPISAMFAASGRALALEDGTLLFAVAAAHTGERWPPLYNYVCRSDDGGRTWCLLPTPTAVPPVGDESKLVELSDGRWLISMRNPRKGGRRYAVSADRGATWGEPGTWHDLPDPACDGDIIRYPKRWSGGRDILLHSIPADSASRCNVSIAVSYDEGLTWPVRRTVWNCPAGYSSLTVLDNGEIGLLTEVGDWDPGYEIWFTRLELAWLEAEPESRSGCRADC